MLKAYLTKICQRCGAEYQPASGVQKYCVECRPIVDNERKRKWDKENIEACLAYGRNWCQKNPQKNLEGSRRWRLNNPKSASAARKKDHAHRRVLGFVPMNQPFDGCEAHHVDQERVIYIPKNLHRSIGHSVFTGKNLGKINAEAFNFLFKQEVNHERI
jgi:hypothetical protein